MSLSSYHRRHHEQRIVLLSRLSQAEAIDLAREAGVELQVDIEGEPWIARADEARNVTLQLHDDSPRRDGRRCRMCGCPRDRVTIGGGYQRGLEWLCSGTCLGEYDDHYDTRREPEED